MKDLATYYNIIDYHHDSYDLIHIPTEAYFIIASSHRI